MADVKVTLKRVIDAQGNTDNIHPTTDWDQVENKPATFTPTAHSLNSHTDVNAVPTADGQVLTWDAANNIWIASVSAGGGVSKLDLQNVYVYGKASGAITIGQAVQFAGAEGDHILIKAAVPSEINANPNYMIGIAETTLANNEFGYVIVNGRLVLDTSTYTAGDILYFDSTVADTTTGALTTTEPTEPDAIIEMAAVSISGVGNGEFVIRNTILTRTISEINGLQAALDSKVNKAGDTMTGNLRIDSGSFASLILDREGSTTTSNVIQFENNNGVVGGIGGFGNDGLQFRTTDGTQMVIDASNNVGIGTTSPASKLHIYDTSGANEIFLGEAAAADKSGILKYNQGNGTGTGTLQFGHWGDNLSTNGITIKKGGNVGIGTASPTAKLTVVDSSTKGLEFEEITGGIMRMLAFDRTNSTYETLRLNGSDLEFRVGTNTAMVVDADGDVGIGTTSPSKKLHIVGDARIEGDLTVNGTMTVVDTDVNTTEQWIITNDGTGPAAIINQTGAQPVIDIQDDGVSAFYIADGGLVGIGTTSPTEKLHIVDGRGYFSQDSSDRSLTVESRNNTKTTIVMRNSTATANENRIGSEGLDLFFNANSSEVMRLNSAGNVGIGTTSPGAKLDVNTGNSSGGIKITANNTYNSQLFFYNESTLRSAITSIAGGNLAFYHNGGDKLVIDNDGNVGIGTTSPSEKLDVQGDIAVSGTVDGVDISGFKTSYDSHNHDGRYYTKTESDDRFLKNLSQTLDLSTLDNNTYYPVTIPINLITNFKIEVNLNSGTVPSWSTHPVGFALVLSWTSNPNGWGTVQIERVVHQWSENWTSGTIVGGITQMGNSNTEVVYLRGGGKYFLRTSDYVTATVRTGSYTINSQTVSPTTSIINNVYQSAAGTSGINRLIVNDKIGIGTESPGQKLDVNGFSRFRDTMYFGAADDQGVISWNSNGFVMLGQSGKGMAFGANGVNDHMYINTSGNVGIGTTSPPGKLTVVTDNRYNDGNGFRVQSSSGATRNLLFLGASSVDDASNIQAYKDGTGAGVKNLLLNALGGNIGIGTTSPADKLTVTDGNIRIFNTGGIEPTIYFSHYNVSSSYPQSAIRVTDEGNWGGHLNFLTKPGGASTNALETRMRINDDGNIGIGTTSPNTKLDVRGGIQRTNARFNNSQRYPLGHYTPGETVFEIDPTWTQEELQAYFNSGNVSWSADSTAPGGYSIQITSNPSFGGVYNAGFPYIPIDQDDEFYMEMWIRSEAGAVNTHYLGSNEFNQSFSSLGGNPGSFGYWVMSNTSIGDNWTKVSGYIGGFSNSIGDFETGTKYWTPMMLANYTNVTGARTSYISGWKVIKVTQPGNRTFTGEIKAKNIHDWQWKWTRYAGLITPGNSSGGAMELWFRTYFLKSTDTIQGEGYLDTRTQVGSDGGFGGSTYGNMFGDLDSYHTHIFTNIYVEKPFTVNVTDFSGDDPHAIFIDEQFVQGNVNCCSNISYSFTFTKGWHKIDLIYSEGGGGDWIRMGWNPKDYTDNIREMNPHAGIERTIEGYFKINGTTSIIGSNGLYFGEGATSGLNGWATRQYASGSNHQFNGQAFTFSNDGYGSTWSASINSSGFTNATATFSGGVKMRVDSTTLYIRSDGNTA